MRRLVNFWALSQCEKKFLCEALMFLSIANACVKGIAFKHIDRFLRNHWKDGVSDDIEREPEIRLVHRSILRAANVLPANSLCLSKSIAEFIMLRRRGIPAALVAGVKISGPSSLDAHAWVDTGMGVNDKTCENSEFATVIRIGNTFR